MEIKVSIIVPVYNVEKYLRKCLDSLVNQTLEKIEIIIINDCSPDNSESIIKEYIKKDSRIVYIKQDFNQGQGLARNKGISIAKGSYVLFVDSDDYIAIDTCKTLYNVANKLDLDILEGGFYKVEKEKEKLHKNHIFENPLNGGDFFEHIDFTVGVIWNKLWKTSFLRNNKLTFVNGYYEDVLFISQSILYANRIYRLDYAFYYYIVRDNSTMTIKISKKHMISQLFLVDKLENIYITTQSKKGSDQHLKILTYALSNLANHITNFETITEVEKQLKDKAKNKLKKLHSKYKYKIIKCNKLGVVQKTAMYISPFFMRFLINKFKK